MNPYALTTHSESPDSTAYPGFNPSKRNFLQTGGVIALGSVVFGAAFTEPACGVDKEKAVKYVGLIIDLSKEASPLLNLLGARDIAVTFDAKVVPTLEKLKDALADVDIPSAGSLLRTVRSVLGAVEVALLSLPESARRTTLMGILASVRILLLTVEAFIDSEMPVPAMSVMSDGGRKSMALSINKALEATR